MTPVAMRLDSDCGIASLATVMGWTYEEAAACCDIELGRDGKPVLPGGGMLFAEIAVALFRRGIRTTNLQARVEANAQWAIQVAHTPRPLNDFCLPTPGELLKLIQGHRGLIGTLATLESLTAHGMAWDGQQAWDCDPAADNTKPLDRPVCEALLIF